MESTLYTNLINMRDDLNHDGWIIIPPCTMPGYLHLRAEWFFDGEKYSYEQRFKNDGTDSTDIDLSKGFIENANREVERYLSRK